MNNDNYELALIWTYIWNYVEGIYETIESQIKVPEDRFVPIIKLCLKHLGWNNEIESFLISWNYHSLIRQVKEVREAA